MNHVAVPAQIPAEARGNMYRFFAGLFLQPPGQEVLRHLSDRPFQEELSAILGEDAVADLTNLTANDPAGTDPEALRQDYMGLFAVPAGRYVMPFEDVYRGEVVNGDLQRGPLLGVHAVAVKGLYRQAGAEMERACRELPTHVGVELSFMAYLCDRESAAAHRKAGDFALGLELGRIDEAGKYRGFQTRFLREHLCEWIPLLSKRIQANARGPFYRSLALITEAFLARDMTLFLADEEHSRP